MYEEFLRLLGLGLCHQLPERSFFGAGVQMPVCARDQGIYVGFMFAVALIALLDRGRRSGAAPTKRELAVAALLVGVMALDGVSSYAGWRVTTNELRLLTGTAAGFGIAMLAVPLLNGELWCSPGPTSPFDTVRALGLYVLGVPVVTIATWYAGSLLGVAAPAVVAFSILFTFTVVNMVIVALLPPFERRAKRLVDVVPAALLGLVITGLELAGASTLKLWLLGLAERLS